MLIRTQIILHVGKTTLTVDAIVNILAFVSSQLVAFAVHYNHIIHINKGHLYIPEWYHFNDYIIRFDVCEVESKMS